VPSGTRNLPARAVLFAVAMAFGAWRPAHAQVATPLPSPSPTPTAATTATPSPEPTLGGQALRELLLEGAYTVGKVYNNYASGLTGTGSSYVASGAYRFGGYALKLDQRVDYFHTIANQPGGTGFTTPDGGYEVVPPFLGKIISTDFRVEHSVFTKSLYVGLSYIDTSTSYGYPDLQGVGIGAEKYSSFKPFDLFGYIYYYPSVSGTFLQTDPKSPNFGRSFGVNYGELKYSFEGSLPLSHDFYAYFGYGGYRMLTNTTTTVQNVEGPFIGLGTRLFRGGAALDEPEVTRLQQTVPTWSGYLEGALRFGGENTLNAVPSAPDSSGSHQFGAGYRYGAWAATADVHTDHFNSFADPFNPVNPTTETDTLTELRALYSVTPHDAYIGIGVLNKSNTNGYGSQTGPGIGLVKMPNLSGQWGYRLSIFYYGTNANVNTPTVMKSESRRYLVYDYGVTYRPPSSGVYGYAGYWGYHGNPGNDPIDETHSGPYLGLGVRFK
jgi:hypothetical protein